MERLKLHESDLIEAHKDLYRFISRAYGSLWSANDPPRDYDDLIKNARFKIVKPNMLFFSSEIREILEKLKE